MGIWESFKRHVAGVGGSGEDGSVTIAAGPDIDIVGAGLAERLVPYVWGKVLCMCARGCVHARVCMHE